MEVRIKGVLIKLTDEQVKKIEKEERARERCRKSFEKMLLRFGFKKIDTSDWEDKNAMAYEHVYYNWFAKINKNFSGDISDVFMAGEGLKNVGFPGGYNYESPKEIEIELVKVMDELSPK